MPLHELPSLAGNAWLIEPRLQALLQVLNAEGETRIVGGAVRNALLGVPVADIDLATTLLPDNVLRLAKAAGFGVHPTGLDHGTVTVSLTGAAFEVTTLRKDVATDGRHAVCPSPMTGLKMRRGGTSPSMPCIVMRREKFTIIQMVTRTYSSAT